MRALCAFERRLHQMLHRLHQRRLHQRGFDVSAPLVALLSKSRRAPQTRAPAGCGPTEHARHSLRLRVFYVVWCMFGHIHTNFSLAQIRKR